MLYLKLIVVSLLTIFSLNGFSGEAEIRLKLSEAIPSIEIVSIAQSEMGGVYVVDTKDKGTLYSDSKGEFFFRGEFYSTLNGRVINLTEKRLKKERVSQIRSIKSDEKLTFPAIGEVKASISVFTDIDCGYCRKFHREVASLNSMGVEVNYLAFPRAGVGSASSNKLVSAWCAEDRLNAMNDAKAGLAIDDKVCINPIASQFELGKMMGVTGTPTIVLEDGTLVPGYLPASRLAKGLGLL